VSPRIAKRFPKAVRGRAATDSEWQRFTKEIEAWLDPSPATSLA
jgi:hypothetical protein